MSEYHNTTIDDITLFEKLEQIVTGYSFGVNGIDTDDLCQAVLENLDAGVDLERSRVLEMIADNAGSDKAFTRLYSANGPVVLSKNFWPLVKVILTYDNLVSVSTVICKLPLYLPSKEALFYDTAFHYLFLIETMVERGHLKINTKMQLSLADKLIYDD
jgi:hypothetical protein